MKLAVRRAFVNTLAQCILSPQKAPHARPLSKTAGLRNCREVAFHAGPALLYAQGHELKTVRLTAHPAKQGNARSRQLIPSHEGSRACGQILERAQGCIDWRRISGKSSFAFADALGQ